MPFFTGKVAFVITGNWVFPVMKEVAPNLDYGVTYIPAADGLKTSWSGGRSVVIPKGSKKCRCRLRLFALRGRRRRPDPAGERGSLTADTQRTPRTQGSA